MFSTSLRIIKLLFKIVDILKHLRAVLFYGTYLLSLEEGPIELFIKLSFSLLNRFFFIKFFFRDSKKIYTTDSIQDLQKR